MASRAAWPSLQRPRAQGLQSNKNGPIITAHQQQLQMTQAQLTYAQKVKGDAQQRQLQQQQAQQQQQQRQQQQQQQGTRTSKNSINSNGIGGGQVQQASAQRHFRMVPAQHLLAGTASNLSIPASALPYPYNYANLHQAYHAQPPPPQPPQAQPQPMHSHHHHRQQTQQQQRQQLPSGNRSRGSARYAAPRDFFFDNSVSSYYPSSSSSSYPHIHQRSLRRPDASSASSAPHNNHHRYGRSNKRRFGQKPSYSSSSSSSSSSSMSYMSHPSKNASNLNNKLSENRAKRRRATDSQLKTYEEAADRDVLCWIYENQGKCRYGEKCQWLHLDRETGKYVPTVYIVNSLSHKEKADHNRGSLDEQHKTSTSSTSTSTNTSTAGGGAMSHGNGYAATGTVTNASAEESEGTSAKELQKKFQQLMEKTIQQNIEKAKLEEDTKRNDESARGDRGHEKKDGRHDGKEKEEEEEEDTKTKEDDKAYGKYGTTFDQKNVCWEFNTFVGCRKGAKCKWAHQYLVKEASHPYTGEKLNGMAVRKFRLNNNI